MNSQDRWYVRFRGHTLGPLTTEQVKSSVRKKELGPDDKLASAKDPTWRELRTQEEFLRCWESLSRPVPVELVPLPSPKVLWQKKREKAKQASTPAPSAPQLKIVKEEAPKEPAEAKAPTPKAVEAKIDVKKVVPKKVAKAKPRPAKKAVPKIAATVAVEAPKEIEKESSEEGNVALSKAEQLSPADDALSMMEVLRDWNQRERDSQKAAPAPVAPILAAPVESPLPARPEVPVMPRVAPEKNTQAGRPIELRLNLTLSKQFLFGFAVVSALALAAIVFFAVDLKKMRGPADFNLPNPSSPTNEPSAENDPIPQLKAPTRPNRD